MEKNEHEGNDSQNNGNGNRTLCRGAFHVVQGVSGLWGQDLALWPKYGQDENGPTSLTCPQLLQPLVQPYNKGPGDQVGR